MKRGSILSGILVFGLAVFLFLTGCEFDATSDGVPMSARNNATELTANVWSDGAVVSDGAQWFKFTATASTQYLHVTFGTMNDMNIQLHSNSGIALGNAQRLRGILGENILSLSVSSGQTYYVRVTSGTGISYTLGSTTGTFKMTFNSVTHRPGTFDEAVGLSSGVWENGNVLTDGEQWYKFTATAGTQYLHVAFGTMNDITVQLYTDSGDALGNAQILQSHNSYNTNYRSYISLLVSGGQVYYLRVTPGSSSFSVNISSTGTYRIAFNASETAPPQ